MERRTLGSSGFTVSAVGLGTMTWGRDTDELDAAEQLRDFVDAGGDLLDTAASYGEGASEASIGRLLKDGTVDRDEVVLCTKAGVLPASRGGTVDASRGALLDSLDGSLRRLGTDHVDLLLVQAPDPRTPLRETLTALRQAVRSGKARYVGLSNHPGWSTALAAAGLRDDPDASLDVVEVEYSLLQRGVEREVVPAVTALGLGLLAWSPLGRGVLTGKYRRTVPADSRAASPHLAGFVQQYLDARSTAVVEALHVAADGLGLEAAQVALAWVLHRPGVASALVGARNAVQLRTSLDASRIQLPAEVVQALDDVSAPELGYPERR